MADLEKHFLTLQIFFVKCPGVKKNFVKKNSSKCSRPRKGRGSRGGGDGRFPLGNLTFLRTRHPDRGRGTFFAWPTSLFSLPYFSFFPILEKDHSSSGSLKRPRPPHFHTLEREGGRTPEGGEGVSFPSPARRSSSADLNILSHLSLPLPSLSLSLSLLPRAAPERCVA